MPKILQIKGAIIPNEDKWVYDMFDMDATSPADVQAVLDEAAGEAVTVNINSGGGDVSSGSEIYTALRSYEGETNGRVVGLAASAASVIAMGCSKLEMSPTAEMMIHNAWSFAEGNHQDMSAAARRLQSADRAISAAYRDKTGKTDEELKALMDDETWFTAEDAKAHGLTDSIMFEGAASLRVAASAGAMLPPAALEAARAQKQAEKKATAAEQPVTAEQLDSFKAEMLEAVKASQTLPAAAVPDPEPKHNAFTAMLLKL